jgi:mevalonate kinase
MNAARTAHGDAPAKLILCGEHAVVYQRPAIAVPLHSLRAHALVSTAVAGSGLQFHAPDIGNDWSAATRCDDPLTRLAEQCVADFGLPADLQIALRAEIPIASGMGSGAAIATALVRALAALAGRRLTAAEQAELVFRSEQGYHGTPSGIDNTVVAYEQPIWFCRRSGQPPLIERLQVGCTLDLVVGDSGIRSPTHLPVGAVREQRQQQPAFYDGQFDAIAALVHTARDELAAGRPTQLGRLLHANQQHLQAIGVSHPLLDQLCAAAEQAGALGAKLAGAGWGGVMLALCNAADVERVRAAISAAGAIRTYHVQVAATGVK